MRHRQALHEMVTVQGLTQVCDTSSNILRRGVWLLIFCGGLAFTTFNIYKQISLYLSAPVNVRVDQIFDNILLFPTITICNNNYAKGSLLDILGLDHVIPAVFPYTDFDEQLPNVNLSQLDLSAIYVDGQLSLNLGHTIEEAIVKTRQDNIFSIEASGILVDGQQALNFGHVIEGAIVECDWESASCGQDDFIYKETDLGKCFTYNVNGSLRSRSSGRAHGLRLLLNVQEEEYTRSINGYLGTGFMIAVHAPEVPAIMSETGIAVTPGFQHFMSIGVKVFARRGSVSCFTGRTGHPDIFDKKRVTAKEGVGGCGEKPLKYFTGNYSRDSCRKECQMRFIVSMCNCKDISNPSDVPLCNPQQIQECLVPALQQYLQTDTGCEAGCPEPCQYTRFTTQHSSSPLSRNYITEYTKAKGKTEEYWRKNLVILEMYFSSLAYENMEKQLGYEILDLFCDIGGALGLLLGASVLTVLEVFDFMFISVFSAVFEKNKVNSI